MYLDVRPLGYEHQPAGVIGIIHKQNCAEIEPQNLMLALQSCAVKLSELCGVSSGTSSQASSKTRVMVLQIVMLKTRHSGIAS